MIFFQGSAIRPAVILTLAEGLQQTSRSVVVAVQRRVHFIVGQGQRPIERAVNGLHHGEGAIDLGLVVVERSSLVHESLPSGDGRRRRWWWWWMFILLLALSEIGFRSVGELIWRHSHSIQLVETNADGR